MTSIARHDPLHYLGDELDGLKTQGLYRHLRVLDGEQKANTTVDDRHGRQPLVEQLPRPDDASRLRAAALEGDRALGVGIGSVRTIAGTMAIHMELERRLAEFKHTESGRRLSERLHRQRRHRRRRS